jgi:hypothetical protein
MQQRFFRAELFEALLRPYPYRDFLHKGERQMSKKKIVITALAGLCLALALVGCGAGGSNTGAAGPGTTPTVTVSPGYQGLVVVTFTASTTYDQAVSILESAGMKLQAQCPNPGPIIADPTITPRPITQENAYQSTHQLTAVGSPSLTQAMITQVESSGQVTTIAEAPKVECPLLR